MMAAFTGLTALLMADQASAEKPDVPPGLAKRGGGQQAAPTGPQVTIPGAPTLTITISPRDRTIIQRYFTQRFAAGHCPPGLAKKNNGCLPPGQAKKWAQGQPLPAGIPYQMLPRELLLQLAPLPAGYQYIRLADDVLLMATGSRMILDAVRDLAGL
jgi:hypothetical protein